MRTNRFGEWVFEATGIDPHGRSTWKCDDCGDFVYADDNMVMLKDDLWSKVCRGNTEDVYCDRCIEKRLGRGLRMSDLKMKDDGGMILCNQWWIEANGPIQENMNSGYHVSNVMNRKSIESKGIDGSGVSPWDGDEDFGGKYPKGNYMWKTVSDARKYGFGLGDPFDIWLCWFPGQNMRKDPVTDGAFYVRNPIPADLVALVESHEKNVSNPIIESAGNIDSMVTGYLTAAVWTEQERLKEEDGPPEDLEDETLREILAGREFDPGDAPLYFDEDSQLDAFEDISKFVSRSGIDLSDMEVAVQAGVDLWLTRNRHGSGFWDKPEVYGYDEAESYAEIARGMGSKHVYINDDGKLSFA